MAFLRGQEARLQALHPDGWGGAWRASSGAADAATPGYVMPADADRFVISFRKQLDRVAPSLPWRSPPSAQHAHAPPLPRTALLDRYEQHTKHCPTCLAAMELTERCLALSKAALNTALMALLVALASRTPPSARFVALAALGAGGYSAALLRAYVVGPVVGALPNKVAAAPLAAAATALVVGALAPSAAHACAVLLPLVTAGASLYAMRALETLRARFVYTEEAKALQIS
jgi:hypothetical protein